MATFKTTWFFEQASIKAGWSETWYVSAVDKTTAHNASISVAIKRAQNLISEATLTFVRTTANLPIAKRVPPIPPPRIRDVLVTYLNLPGSTLSSFGAAVPWVAALVRWTSNAAEVFRMQEIRGLPGNAYESDSDKFAKAAAQQLIAQIIPFMIPAGFGIMHGRGFPKTFVPVSGGMYERISRRATGRPFGLPVGRHLRAVGS